MEKIKSKYKTLVLEDGKAFRGAIYKMYQERLLDYFETPIFAKNLSESLTVLDQQKKIDLIIADLGVDETSEGSSLALRPGLVLLKEARKKFRDPIYLIACTRFNDSITKGLVEGIPATYLEKYSWASEPETLLELIIAFFQIKLK